MAKLGSRLLVPLACALVCALALLVLPQAAMAIESYDGAFTFAGTGAITASPETSDNFVVTSADEDKEAYVTIKAGGTYKLSGSIENGYGAHVIVNTKEAVTLEFEGDTTIRSKSDPALSFKTGSNVRLVGPTDSRYVSLWDGADNSDNAAIKVSKNSTCTFVTGTFMVFGNRATPDKQGKVKQNAIKGGAGTAIVFGDPEDELDGPSVTVGAPLGNGISSDGSITFNEGYFTVGSPFNPVGKDGIKSVPDDGEDGDGTITINDGTFAVYAKDDGISAAKKVTISHCWFLGNTEAIPGLDAGGHAITCAGDVEIISTERSSIRAGGDGIHADGTVTLGTTGDEYAWLYIESKEEAGAEGIKAAHVVLNNADLTINSYDDAISGSDADGKTGLIELKGGNYTLLSRVGDAFDSNGDFTVSGGTAVMVATNKDESLVDVLGSFNITGGKIIGLGNSEQTMQLPTNGTYATANLESGAEPPAKNSDVMVFKKVDEVRFIKLGETLALYDNLTAYFYAGDDIADGDTVQFYETAGVNPSGKLLATATAKTNVGVTSVSLDRTTLQLAAGTSANLKATVKPDNATDKTIIWSTSDDGIATVDANGKVTGITTGTCTITAKAKSTGVTAQCTVTVTPKTSQMFRLYNPNSGEHFYTSSAGERDAVKAAGWTYEGVAWNAPADGEPVYRLYNEFGGEHHYCTSANERASLIAAGWKDEGIGWYSDTNRGVKILRAYNPNAFANNHNFTADTHEQSTLVSLGWKDEGVAWYGAK